MCLHMVVQEGMFMFLAVMYILLYTVYISRSFIVSSNPYHFSIKLFISWFLMVPILLDSVLCLIKHMKHICSNIKKGKKYICDEYVFACMCMDLLASNHVYMYMCVCLPMPLYYTIKQHNCRFGLSINNHAS